MLGPADDGWRVTLRFLRAVTGTLYMRFLTGAVVGRGRLAFYETGAECRSHAWDVSFRIFVLGIKGIFVTSAEEDAVAGSEEKRDQEVGELKHKGISKASELFK